MIRYAAVSTMVAAPQQWHNKCSTKNGLDQLGGGRVYIRAPSVVPFKMLSCDNLVVLER